MSEPRIVLWRRAVSLINNRKINPGPLRTCGYTAFQIEYSADNCKFDMIVWKPEEGSEDYAVMDLTMSSDSKEEQLRKFASISPG